MCGVAVPDVTQCLDTQLRLAWDGGDWPATVAVLGGGGGTCSFDHGSQGMCAWKSGGKAKWTRGTGTPSAGTGATRAESGAYFVFLETT